MASTGNTTSSKKRTQKSVAKQSKLKRMKTETIPFAACFKLPSYSTQIDAIGCDKLTPEYEPSVYESCTFFPPIPHPTSIDDWLAQYFERGQSYKQYLYECPWISKVKGKDDRHFLKDQYPNHKIYLLPLGEFVDGHSVDFELLKEYTELFLGLPTESLPNVDFLQQGNRLYWSDPAETNGSEDDVFVSRNQLHSRHDSDTGNSQLCVDTLLYNLRRKLPDDALCLIGLTMHDLYADDKDLFVAGMARGGNRVAVFSFKRYDPCLTFSPEFWYDTSKSEKVRPEIKKRLMLQRSCKLLVHEIGHILGLGHCIFFSCCMNGSGHLEEDFRQPMHLCPVDLHKLQTLVGFDIVERYTHLLKFYSKHDMVDEATWVKKRLAFIERRATTSEQVNLDSTKSLTRSQAAKLRAVF